MGSEEYKKEMNMLAIPKTLTIAGSDSGGGAGIQADLKTFSALGCYGSSVITALTAQNTQGVINISGVEPSFIKDQLNAVLDDIGAGAIKIGMLHSSEVINGVADVLARYHSIPIVVDPVMVAKSGDRLLKEEAIETLKRSLLPLAKVVTPNLPEAEVLTGEQVKDQLSMETQLPRLSNFGPDSVLLKGGHLNDSDSPDFFYNAKDNKTIRLPGKRIQTSNTHGTGCTLSSAIAAYLATGYEPYEAVSNAKAYMNQALRAGSDLQVGQGKGPVHHFFNWWSI